MANVDFRADLKHRVDMLDDSADPPLRAHCHTPDHVGDAVDSC